jgi:hypothetical protein
LVDPGRREKQVRHALGTATICLIFSSPAAMKARIVKSAKKGLPVTRAKLIRAVASSTAIETGESVGCIEARLKSGARRFKNLKLA